MHREGADQVMNLVYPLTTQHVLKRFGVPEHTIGVDMHQRPVNIDVSGIFIASPPCRMDVIGERLSLHTQAGCPATGRAVGSRAVCKRRPEVTLRAMTWHEGAFR